MLARSLLLRLSLGATLLAAAPAALSAQSVVPSFRLKAPTPVATLTSAPAPAGPRVASTIAGIDVRVADTPRLPAPVVAGRTTRGQAMAIVGGAAFLGGLIIGDDVGTVIAVGGLGVGIYGLWLWLK